MMTGADVNHGRSRKSNSVAGDVRLAGVVRGLVGWVDKGIKRRSQGHASEVGR